MPVADATRSEGACVAAAKLDPLPFGRYRWQNRCLAEQPPNGFAYRGDCVGSIVAENGLLAGELKKGRAGATGQRTGGKSSGMIPLSAMPRRVLGRTGLQVSVLGFGTAPLGDLYAKLDDATA